MNRYGFAVGLAFLMMAPVVVFAYDANYALKCTQSRFSSTPTEEANKPNAEIVFYGDSRMESTCILPGGTVKVYERTLPQAVASELGIDYARIRERSRDGTSTANLNYGWFSPNAQWTTTNYLGDLNQLPKAKVVVLAFGTNDVWYDIQHANDPVNYPAGPLPFKDRLKQMAQVALDAGKSVVLVEPYKACKYGSYFPNQPAGEAARITFLDGALQPYVGNIGDIVAELNGDSRYAGRVERAALYSQALDCSETGTDTVDGLHASHDAILRLAKVVATAAAKFPLVSSSVSKNNFALGENPLPTFNWNAKNANSVTALCTSAVGGAYSGTSLVDAVSMQPMSGGQGTCTVTATNVAGLTATDSQTVTVQVPPPSITTSISNSTPIVGASRSTIFSWHASNASSVLVQCTGGLAGAYSGASLQDGIYAEPVSVGPGSCTATAYNTSGQSATNGNTLTVLTDGPTVTSSIDSATLTLGGGNTVFRWNAINATTVTVQCLGSVGGAYQGPSLQDAIYAVPLAVGNGACSVTATNAAGKTQVSTVNVTVQ